MKYELQHVQFMPKELQPGILYVSKEFEIAMHLCPCGCGSKVKTPLGPTEWSIQETKDGPSMSPSIGNWQQACQSHYWITNGEISWAGKWSPEQILAGRQAEEERRRVYYKALDDRRGGFLRRFWIWLKGCTRNL